MTKTELIKRAAFRAAKIVGAAGGTCPVVAFHEIFDDVASDPCGWPHSKMAAEVLSEVEASGMGKVALEGDGYYLSINSGVVDFFGELSDDAKTAAASMRPEQLKEASRRYSAILAKYAALESVMDRRFNPAPDPVAAPAVPTAVKPAAPPPPTFDQVKELELWSRWKKTGNQADLSELLDRYEPVIRRGASTFYAAPIPRSALNAEAKSIAMEAFDRYDPKHGVKLNTFVMSYMPKMHRFVNIHQNVGYIPEAHTMKIGKFNAAVKELTDINGGVAPDAGQLSDHLSWHIEDVKKMRRLLRKDIIGENVAGGSAGAPPQAQSMDIFLDYLYRELDGREKTVFEHIYGKNGAPKIDSIDAMAAATGLSTSSINRSKAKIAAIADRHIRNFDGA